MVARKNALLARLIVYKQLGVQETLIKLANNRLDEAKAIRRLPRNLAQTEIPTDTIPSIVNANLLWNKSIFNSGFNNAH
jgi:hypothetical protein